MSEKYGWDFESQKDTSPDYEQRQSDYDQLKRRRLYTPSNQEQVPLNEEPVEPQSESTPLNEEPVEPQSEQVPLNEESTEPQGEQAPINQEQAVSDYNQLDYQDYRRSNYDKADDAQQGYGWQGDNPSQAYGQSQEYSQQQAYDQQPQQPYYNQPQDYREPYYAPQQEPAKPKKLKKDGVGFGIASLVLGILSIFLFMTCVNYIMAILAVIFGIVQLCTRKKKGMAITGIITSIVGILLSSLLWICVFNYLQDGGADNLYNDFYYYDTDDYSTWYNDEL